MVNSNRFVNSNRLFNSSIGVSTSSQSTECECTGINMRWRSLSAHSCIFRNSLLVNTSDSITDSSNFSCSEHEQCASDDATSSLNMAISETHLSNHPSATNFPLDVDAYFTKETQHKAIVGPCDNIPFPVHYSPLLSRPKPDDTRRVIVNMSYPYGASLNDRISNTHYDGVDFTLKYPSVEDIVHTVQELGNDVLLSKIYVSRAFRNLRVDSRMRDKILQAIVRTIWLLAASHDIRLCYSHIPGVQNKEADALSRVFQNQELDQFCKELLATCICWPVNGLWCVPNVFL